ncbi:chaperonin 10-like protein [Aspergillus karnatakaensis]|uniref:zinc-dependent alcohol dehydrogenase family protein n=1 Tax=Aspergillus karnatakaensis TaxID=1810916 RepID=UPI003CCDD20C
MSTQPPATTSAWLLHGTSSNPADPSEALTWTEKLDLPPLGPTDVLVKLYAWAINYPDLAVANGTFPWDKTATTPRIPGSDGAGEVLATGTRVKTLKPHDRVIPLYYPNFPSGNAPTPAQMRGTPGSSPSAPGTFRLHAVFDKNGLIKMPWNLTYAEAATLPCSALTAWNALNGITPLKKGDYVLAQETGGVSIFAILFALHAGAVVVATTSDERKAARLKDMGVQHGVTARNLTPNQLGLQRVIEVGGPQTIKQSFECVAAGGEICIIGFLTGLGYGSENGPTYLEPLLRACLVRGVEVGNRVQFEEMVAVIEECGIRPVLDGRRFGFGELREAYRYVWGRGHFGKVVLEER